MGVNLIRAHMERLEEEMRARGWDAKVTAIEQGDGTIIVGLSAWLSILPGGAAFPSPELSLPDFVRAGRAHLG